MEVLVCAGMLVLKVLGLVAYVVGVVFALNWAACKGHLGEPIEEGDGK